MLRKLKEHVEGAGAPAAGPGRGCPRGTEDCHVDPPGRAASLSRTETSFLTRYSALMPSCDPNKSRSRVHTACSAGSLGLLLSTSSRSRRRSASSFRQGSCCAAR